VTVKNIGPEILTDIHVLGPLNTKKGLQYAVSMSVFLPVYVYLATIT
jgi:hypothetical protein